MVSQEALYAKAHEREQRALSVIQITSPGGSSSAEVSRQGAAINKLHLAGRQVLVSAEVDWLGHTPGKRDTSHSTLPFGPNGNQPQHGLSRYLDYDVSTSVQGLIEMSARDPLLSVGHSQEVWLSDNEVVVTDDIVNIGDQPKNLSFGKHYYFSVLEQDIPNVRISQSGGGGLTVRRPNGELLWGEFADFLPHLNAGEPLVCENFTGQLNILTPDNHLLLCADALLLDELSQETPKLLPMQLAIWHRPGEDTLCFEPLTGVKLGDDGELFNNQVELDQDYSLRFFSSIERL